MGYIIENITFDQAKQMATEFNYALLYRLSEIRLCDVKDLTDEAWKECTEARMFREDAEIHIIWDEDETIVIFVKDTDDEKDDDFLVKEYRLNGKYAKFGAKGTVMVKQYLDKDIDGQKYIALTRLMGIL